MKKKKLWQKVLIKLALSILRFAGDTPVKYETKEEVTNRRISYFEELINAGYAIIRMTEYQYRINGVLDIYPKNARWHNIKTGRRGGFQGKNLARFVRTYFKKI